MSPTARTLGLANLALAAWLLLPLVSGCATLNSAGVDLPRVDFFVDRTSAAQLAGVDLTRVRRFEDLRATEVLTVAAAIRNGRLPLRFDLHVGADNPSRNTIDLHLDRLEWTLLLEGRETVRGDLRQSLVLGAGRTTDIAVPIELDLLRFFDDNAEDLVRLVLRLAGAGGPPTNVRLRARPTLRTPFGSFRYPNDITIASRDV